MAGYNRIRKKDGAPLSDLEVKVDEALNELLSNKDSALFSEAQAARLYALSAVSVEMDGTKAIVLFVPYKQLKLYKQSHRRLVEELEKKFSGSHVVIIGQRKILGAAYKRDQKSGNKGPRPRSRTLTHVKEAVLEDVVYPTEIVGKRTIFRSDGTKQIKILLDPMEQVRAETKIDTFQAVYKSLMHINVTFEFASSS